MPETPDVSLETLRAHCREQAALTSVRDVADRAGVGRSTLQNFVNGETGHPHPRVRAALLRLYLADRKRAGEPVPLTAPWTDPEVQLAARVLERAFRKAQEPVPEWLARIVTD